MALNLSTLTNPATSGTVLAEALTTADFLDPVPILKNLSRGSNKGGDAKQTTALNQPKALPLIDGDGYLYLPSVAGNYASIPDSSGLDITGDITLECDFIVPEFPLSANRTLLAKYNINTNARSYTMVLDASGNIGITLSQDGTFNPNFLISKDFSLVLSSKTRATVKVTWRQSDGRTQFFIKESDGSFTQVSNDATLAATSIYNSNAEFEIGSRSSGQSNFGSSLGVFGARIYASVDGTDKRLDVDFTATNVRHGDTKFKCATGQVVTINQDSSSSNDVATIIKKPVLRFDGANSSLQGLFANNINSGYMFAAFSVLGTGGEHYGRVFSVQDSTEGVDYTSKGVAFSLREQSTNDLASYYGSNFNIKNDLFDDDNGDILHEVRILNTQHLSKTNNTAALTDSRATSSVDSDTFNICRSSFSNANLGAIDLEYLAVFPATITDDQADSVRNYINNRNNVFDLKDGFGYYFYDAQSAPVGAITTGSSSWNGRIVGSDNGDTDKFATQGTTNDAPVGDGFVVTFADNSDHLEIPQVTLAASDSYAWMVCGTSLGTFSYKVTVSGETELNLLGHTGHAVSYFAGDLYGIILLPESATGADIEAARKLLIDRGAADGTSSSAAANNWYGRNDIVEFKHLNTSSLIDFRSSFRNCLNLSVFPALELSNVNDFSSAWNGCSALTSFPQDAKLGTEANNVNFQDAWRDSGLTSFSTPLPTAMLLGSAWRDTPLTSFESLIPMATRVNASWRGTSLSSFSTPLTKTENLNRAWLDCTSLTNFSADVLDNWNPALLTTGIFNLTWDGCTSLTAQSVENILTSIDASGKYATSDGDPYQNGVNSQLNDAGIDIDYNTVGGTSLLSAATNAAIDSLSGKGWEVYINNVLVIPNILDLAPAAAYSLRSFDANADPNVVNVRRSSDSALRAFKASEVSDGTLTSWVGAGNDGHVTTWYDQAGSNDASQTLVSNMPLLVDAGTLVTEGGKPALNFPTEISNLSLDHSDLYGQATLDSYYVTKPTGNEYIYPSLVFNNSVYGMVARSGDFSTNVSNLYGSPVFYANGTQITGGTRDTLHTATSGVQKLVAHIGADTTDSRWGTASMNFGNYNNNEASSIYSFTGKLQEMIFFNTDQSANRTGIENNINDHFTIYS